MKPQSAKAKGRKLQQWVRNKITELFGLEPGDVESRSMGAGGEDVMLSPAARKKFPYQVECKSLASIAVYKYLKQATGHGKHTPLLIMRQNRSEPIVIMWAEDFFKLVEEK
jgi:hypothetical protein